MEMDSFQWPPSTKTICYVHSLQFSHPKRYFQTCYVLILELCSQKPDMCLEQLIRSDNKALAGVLIYIILNFLMICLENEFTRETWTITKTHLSLVPSACYLTSRVRGLTDLVPGWWSVLACQMSHLSHFNDAERLVAWWTTGGHEFGSRCCWKSI